MKRFVFIIVAVVFLAGTAAAEACSTCGNKNHFNIHNDNRYYYGGSAKASASSLSVANQWMANTQQIGNVTASAPTSIEIGGTSVPNKMTVAGDFLEVPAYHPAPPMDYRGPFEKSAAAGLQPWFSKPKWIRDFLKEYPKSGRVTAGVIEKADERTWFYCIDARKEGVPRKGIKIADVLCESETAQDNAITVWGACADKLMKIGAEHVYITAATVTHWVGWESDNKGGTVGGASIFGLLFGITGQGGTNMAKGTSGPVDKIALVIEAFASTPPVSTPPVK